MHMSCILSSGFTYQLGMQVAIVDETVIPQTSLRRKYISITGSTEMIYASAWCFERKLKDEEQQQLLSRTTHAFVWEM